MWGTGAYIFYILHYMNGQNGYMLNSLKRNNNKVSLLLILDPKKPKPSLNQLKCPHLDFTKNGRGCHINLRLAV